MLESWQGVATTTKKRGDDPITQQKENKRVYRKTLIDKLLFNEETIH